MILIFIVSGFIVLLSSLGAVFFHFSVLFNNFIVPLKKKKAGYLVIFKKPVGPETGN